jgi:hypothetical protein
VQIKEERGEAKKSAELAAKLKGRLVVFEFNGQMKKGKISQQRKMIPQLKHHANEK